MGVLFYRFALSVIRAGSIVSKHRLPAMFAKGKKYSNLLLVCERVQLQVQGGVGGFCGCTVRKRSGVCMH